MKERRLKVADSEDGSDDENASSDTAYGNFVRPPFLSSDFHWLHSGIVLFGSVVPTGYMQSVMGYPFTTW